MISNSKIIDILIFIVINAMFFALFPGSYKNQYIVVLTVMEFMSLLLSNNPEERD